MPTLAVMRSSRPAIVERCGARGQHVLGDHLGAGKVDALAHDDELVAAEPGDRIRGSDRADLRRRATATSNASPTP